MVISPEPFFGVPVVATSLVVGSVRAATYAFEEFLLERQRRLGWPLCSGIGISAPGLRRKAGWRPCKASSPSITRVATAEMYARRTLNAIVPPAISSPDFIFIRLVEIVPVHVSLW